MLRLETAMKQKEIIKMKNRIRSCVPLILIAGIVLAACGGKANRNGIVPDSLQTIEAAAEDIIDFAESGNWDKIDQDVMSIAAAWKSYQPQAIKDGAPQTVQDLLSSALTRLGTASAVKDESATMQSANDLSAAVIELFAVYNPAIPADIGRLDVLERQVVLDVAANDFTAATANLAKVKTVWETVKPSVLAHNGKDVADQFESSLTTQASALNAEDGSRLTNEAKNGLEIVDALEQLY
jgi:hypothetical protein